jgi:hypothetical protein
MIYLISLLQRNAVQCVRCGHCASRLYRLRSHAYSKHEIQPGSTTMDAYLNECALISCKGRRSTTEGRLLRIMGVYASSKSHRLVVRRVLNAHLISIRGADRHHTGEELQGKCANDPIPSGISSLPRGRFATSRKLRAFGFQENFVGVRLCHAAREYVKILRELPDFEAMKAKRDSYFIHRFVAWARAKDEEGFHRHTDWSFLTSIHLPKQFVHELSLALQPASVRNHAFAILQLLERVQVTPRLRNQLTRGQLSRLRKSVVQWTEAKRTQDRMVRRVQRARIASSDFEPAPVQAICETLRRLQEYNILKIHLFDLEKWRRCSAQLENDTIPSELLHSWRTLVCYMATIIMLQGQRLCVALNLTVDEFKKAKWCQGMAVIRVKKHKTGAESGPAAVTLKRQQHDIFQRFCVVRSAVFPIKETAPLLLSVNGTHLRNDNILKPLEKLIAKAGEKRKTMAFNWVRKTIETCSAELLGQAAEEASAGIMRYLCHSPEVTKMHYRFRTDKIIVRQYRQVELVISLLVVIGELEKRAHDYLPRHWDGEYDASLYFFYL